MNARRLFLLQSLIIVANAGILAWGHANTLITALLLLPLLAVTLAVHRAPMRRLCLLAIPMGLVGEVWAVHWQVWTYEYSDIWGVPLYIGLAWALMAAFLASLFNLLQQETD